MTILKLRMISDEDGDFARAYEVMSGMNLEDFHNFICDDLDYDQGNFSSFFLSDEKWNKLQEYTLVDMQDEDMGTISLPMKDTLLGEIMKNPKDRLIFMFDILAARSFFLELQEAGDAEDGVRYPRIAYSEGDAPPQQDSQSIMTDESPFEDMMSEFADFEGDDNFSDDF